MYVIIVGIMESVKIRITVAITSNDYYVEPLILSFGGGV